MLFDVHFKLEATPIQVFNQEEWPHTLQDTSMEISNIWHKAPILVILGSTSQEAC